MADKVTLGGDRLGSGEKIQVERHIFNTTAVMFENLQKYREQLQNEQKLWQTK